VNKETKGYIYIYSTGEFENKHKQEKATCTAIIQNKDY